MAGFGIIIRTALLLTAMTPALAAPPANQLPVQQLPGPPPPAPATGVAPGTAISPSVYAAATIRQFLTVCSNDQGGCADEVGNALINKMRFDGRSNICLPGPDYAGPALKWLDAHPEAQAMPTEDEIYLALQNVYPCA